MLRGHNPDTFHPALILWAVTASLRAWTRHLNINCLPETVDSDQLVNWLRSLRYLCFKGENTDKSNGWRTWEVCAGKKSSWILLLKHSHINSVVIWLL